MSLLSSGFSVRTRVLGPRARFGAMLERAFASASMQECFEPGLAEKFEPVALVGSGCVSCSGNVPVSPQEPEQIPESVALRVTGTGINCRCPTFVVKSSEVPFFDGKYSDGYDDDDAPPKSNHLAPISKLSRSGKPLRLADIDPDKFSDDRHLQLF